MKLIRIIFLMSLAFELPSLASADSICEHPPAACAPWLSEACSGPFRLDQKSNVQQLVNIYALGEAARGSDGNSCSGTSLVPGAPNLNQFTLSPDGQSAVRAVNRLPGAEGGTGSLAARIAERSILVYEMKIGKANENDVGAILKAYADHGIPETLTAADVSSALQSFERQVALLAKDKSLKRSAARELGPLIINLKSAFSGDTADASPHLEELMNLLRSGPENAQKVFELVKDRAAHFSNTPEENTDALDTFSPYYAKLILFYNLKRKLGKTDSSRAIMDGLVSGLQLKAPLGSKTDADHYLLHNGYFYDPASRAMMLAGADPFSRPNKRGEANDCSSYAQDEIEAEIHEKLGFRLTSENEGRLKTKLRKWGVNVDIQPLNDAGGDLKPGDMIFVRSTAGSGPKDGHVMIVSGYSRTKGGPPQIVLTDDIGVHGRTFSFRTDDLLAYNGQGGCPTFKRDYKFLSEDGTEVAYRIRLSGASTAAGARAGGQSGVTCSATAAGALASVVLPGPQGDGELPSSFIRAAKIP